MAAKHLFRAARLQFTKLFIRIKPMLEEDRRWLKYVVGIPVLISILCSIGIVTLGEIFPQSPLVFFLGVAWLAVLASYSLFLLISLFVMMLRPVLILEDDTIPNVREVDSMAQETRQSRTEAIALLGFATAVFGFGVFNLASSRSLLQRPNWSESTAIQAETLCFCLSLIFYLSAIMSIRPILLKKIVTGKHVVGGPLFMLFMLVLAVVGMLVAGNLQQNADGGALALTRGA